MPQSVAELRTLLERRWPGAAAALNVAVDLQVDRLGAAQADGRAKARPLPLLQSLPAGRLTEVFGPQSSGKTTWALAVVAAITSADDLAAYVDLPGSFFAPAAAGAGVDLRRLLVVRPRSAAAARRAVDALVRGGACAVVVFDCGSLGDVLQAQHCTRLVAQAEKTGTRLLIVSCGNAAVVASFASLRLRACGLMPLWQDGSGGGRLAGCALVVEVVKARTFAPGVTIGHPATRWIVALPDVAGTWPVDAAAP